MLRPLRNFWMPWVTTIVLAFFSNAVAQVSYKVTDLGVLHSSNNLGCAMDINNEGWAYVMSADMPPGEQDQLGGGHSSTDVPCSRSTDSRSTWARSEERTPG